MATATFVVRRFSLCVESYITLSFLIVTLLRNWYTLRAELCSQGRIGTECFKADVQSGERGLVAETLLDVPRELS